MSDAPMVLQAFVTEASRKHPVLLDGLEVTKHGIPYVLEKPERCLLILDPGPDTRLSAHMFHIDAWPEEINVRHIAFAGAQSVEAIDAVIRSAFAFPINANTLYLEYRHHRYWRRKPRREWIFVSGLASIVPVLSEDELYWRLTMFVHHLVLIGELGHRGILHIGLEDVPTALIERVLAASVEQLQNVEIAEGA